MDELFIIEVDGVKLEVEGVFHKAIGSRDGLTPFDPAEFEINSVKSEDNIVNMLTDSQMQDIADKILSKRG